MRILRYMLVGAALLGAALCIDTASANTQTVRFTVYLDRGVMYSGYHTHWGAAACSWNYPIGTQLVLPDGMVVTCLDRGLLGSSGWLDLWVPDWQTGRWLQAYYGTWTDVTVVRWGWG